MGQANDKKGDASVAAIGRARGREERQKVPFGKRVKKFELFRHFEYYILALPAMVVFFLFAYLPLCGIVLAFKDYNITGGIFGSPWVEPLFSNFAAYFNGPFFLRTTLNTLIINASNLVFTTIFSVGTAIMIKELFSDTPAELRLSGCQSIYGYQILAFHNR